MGLRPIYWAIILSIMKQPWHLSEHIPLTLLLDESFSMLSVHLWPFSVFYFPIQSGKIFNSFVPLVSERDSPPCFIRIEMLAGFHSREKLQHPTSFIKTLSITMSALISCCSVWLEWRQRLRRTSPKMNSDHLCIKQVEPQRRNSMGEGNHKETFKSKESGRVSAKININMS